MSWKRLAVLFLIILCAACTDTSDPYSDDYESTLATAHIDSVALYEMVSFREVGEHVVTFRDTDTVQSIQGLIVEREKESQPSVVDTVDPPYLLDFDGIKYHLWLSEQGVASFQYTENNDAHFSFTENETEQLRPLLGM
ncbi:hypothetical protein [Geomicrobium sp. JCM 19039]|uniref:hypothetical protein n=1 Tax=Geomicrobium sp. JCM 19039 TaxID=1460636 RepID=UPI00045F2ADC|nr:hypothetical protein [Geomicrobium sp. JCM 19039]GAK11094.1 hypothetical protein JCM19039_767 [Geomicrobium sp. JCM 19039]